MPAKKSYADSINKMKLMLAGIKNHQAALVKRGVDEAFISDFEGTYNNAQTIDNEQEKMKADLKAKTAELDTVMAVGLKKYADTKKLVKMTIPKEQWMEFGIEDKQ